MNGFHSCLIREKESHRVEGVLNYYQIEFDGIINVWWDFLHLWVGLHSSTLGETTTKSYGKQIQWDNNKGKTLAIRQNETIAKKLQQINIIKQ